MALASWCTVGTWGEVAWIRDLMIHLVWGRLRHGIVVGRYQGRGIFWHADLTVLALWGGNDFWDGCGVL